MNKYQILIIDSSGNYRFDDYQSLNVAVPAFRRHIERSSTLICDLRICGDLEPIASYRNYKLLKIRGL